jgi:ankyrin repeat protein
MSKKKMSEGKRGLVKDLIYSAMNNNLDEVKRLLSDKVRYKRSHDGDLVQRLDVNGQNEYGETALYQAAYNGHYNMMKFLLDNGASVNLVNKVSIPELGR